MTTAWLRHRPVRSAWSSLSTRELVEVRQTAAALSSPLIGRLGAIMFGDALADERAERLIAQLAQTRQPFQCAHGRPSLVPIARLAPGALGRPSVDLSQLTCT